MYVQYTNPATLPPLEQSSRILAAAGWDVLFVGSGVPGDADRLRFPAHPRVRVVQLAYQAPGWRQKVHYLRFALLAFAYALCWRPDWIYASDVFGCPALDVVQRLLGLRHLYHEHDSPNPILEHSWFGRVCLSARQRVAQRAVACLAPNPERAAQLQHDLRPRRAVVVVPNYPRIEEVRPARAPRSADDTLRVYYHGHIAPSLMPLAVLEAVAKLPPRVRLSIAGYAADGATDYRRTVTAEACRLGIDDRVEILPARPRHALLELCSQHDVGLALLPAVGDNDNLRQIVGASNKVSDYLACGLVPLVPDAPAWRAAYVDGGMALACDPTDPNSIRSVLQWLLEHPSAARAMGERGRQRILAEWNYERHFQPVLDLLAEESPQAGV
jgi:glycosyltransferase involved in cell wall biosynthesis